MTDTGRAHSGYGCCRLRAPRTLPVPVASHERGETHSYLAALRARLLSLTRSGDELTFKRLSRLFEPGQHATSILAVAFELARPMAQRAYFDLITEMTAAIDGVIVRRHGLAAGYADRSVTGFFLAEELGSRSQAAQVAIEAGREVAEAIQGVAAGIPVHDDGPSGPGYSWRKIGLHWADELFIGQVVTGGRIELTTFGPELAECALIQRCARDGEVLASSTLIGQLSDRARSRLALGLDGPFYRTIAEVPTGAASRRFISVRDVSVPS